MEAVEQLKISLESIGLELQKVKATQKQIQDNNQPNFSKSAEVNAETSKPNGEFECDKPSASHIQSVETTDPLTAGRDQNYQVTIVKLTQQIEELYIKFNLISKAVSNLETSLDDLEQYGRRNCLILHGFSKASLPNPHTNYWGFLDKVLSTINHHLDLDIHPNFIDIAHPLRAASNGKIPIIIKFLRRCDRNLVFQRKKMLAHSGLAITESLTKKKLALLTEPQALLGKENAWSHNGIIYCKVNSKREAVKSQAELYLLIANKDT